MQKILLVEDDLSLGSTLKALLEKEGFRVHLADSKASASSFIAANEVDLAVLDVGLPDGNGFEVAAEIRNPNQTNDHGHTPIIFLTAMNTAEYRLKGFELGADDYIPKPFHLRELLLRISKVLSKVPQPIQSLEVVHKDTTQSFELNGVIIDPLKGCIVSKAAKVEYLARRDLQVLKILLQNAPKIVTRADIVKAMGNMPTGSVTNSSNSILPSTRSIDNSVVRLRQLLLETNCECIRAVRGLGYQWIAKDS